MTIKNTLLGGPENFADNTKSSSVDLNDTFDALILYGKEQSNQVPPIGSIISFHKDWLVSRTIPDGWVSCNGQVLSDSLSLLNGQTIPSLNGTTDSNKLFLMGSSTSNTYGGSSLHSHTQSTGLAYKDSGCSRASHSRGLINSDTSIPPYFEIHWIMRVR